jgi:5-methylthioadenosine/S-adenosylhomocysteine deaminase
LTELDIQALLRYYQAKNRVGKLSWLKGCLLRNKFLLLIVLLSISTLALSDESRSLMLRGTVVTPDEVIVDGFVLIVGDRISAVGPFAQRPGGVTVTETEGIIVPGLIDLHNHITWNLFPRWRAGALFSNRYDWQQLTSYNIALPIPHAKLYDDKLQCEMNLYGEVKAIANGATSVVGSLSPAKDDPNYNRCIQGLARNLDFYSGFYGRGAVNKEKLRYEVFPFQLTDGTDIVAQLKDGRLTSFIAHVAEGKPTDASAAREFLMFKKQGFLVKGTTIVHGVALTQPQFRDMATQGVGLVWSPRSNVELYGSTTDIATAKSEKVKIAIAPDWSPSGSEGMLDEMKYAAVWNAGTLDPATQKPLFLNSDIVKMATIYPAELAGLGDKIGKIAPNMYADLLILRQTRPDPYESIVHSSAPDVMLVMIDGIATYGDLALMRKLAPSAKSESLTVCKTQKVLNTNSYVYGQGTSKVWETATTKLGIDLNQWGTSLASLVACPEQ